MITHLNEAEKAVHYPADRRSFIAVKPYMLVIFGILVVGLIGIAWLQYLLIGLPAEPSLSIAPITSADPTAFPCG